MHDYKSYAGFTIGPIHDVMSHSRKTRELWFGSYFFSWFMEKMIEHLAENNEITFFTPYVQKPFQPNTSRAGKYHDRFVIATHMEKNELFDIIEKAAEATMESFVDLIDKLTGSNYMEGRNRDDIKKILDGYIQRNFVVLDAEVVDGNAAVGSVDKYLDAMEENRFFAPGVVSGTCFVCKTLPGVVEREIYGTENNKEEKKARVLCPLCFLKYFCYKSGEILGKIEERRLNYPSIARISARELFDIPEISKWIKEKYENEDDIELKEIEEIIKGFNREKEKSYPVKHYHKYFAVVQSDGDRLGELAKAVKNPQNLSKRLFDFAGFAEELVKSYKGEPVYIGGDDMLAFMPVAIAGDKGSLRTIFDFAVELSRKYCEIVNKDIDDKRSSLSVGINIAYYKFPLSIAIEDARRLLQKAKQESKKNTLSMGLTRHSGYRTEFKFRFGSDEVDLFSEISKGVLSGDIEMPHSIHHNLARSKTSIAYIPDETRLTAFFENNFNEPEHGRSYDGIFCIREWFKMNILPIQIDNVGKRLTAIDDILNKLSFIKFLRSDT